MAEARGGRGRVRRRRRSARVAFAASRRLRNPWRKPRFLAVFTWGYLAWSLVPIGIAVRVSFNQGFSVDALQGWSLTWWRSFLHDPELRTALFLSLKLSAVTLIFAVPMGVAFAIGIDRWRGRVGRAVSSLMLLKFVVPEILVAVALFLTFQHMLKLVHLGVVAEALGLITYELPLVVLVVRARLLTMNPQLEDAAMDLGASPRQAVGRVVLPLLRPAIIASSALVFAGTIDDFITVNYLSGYAPTQPITVKIYGAVRAGFGPDLNAAASFTLLAASLALGVGYVAYRATTRYERAGSIPTGGI